MAYRLAAIEDSVPFEVQIRTLPDETLLDIWEEMQQVQAWLSEQYQQGVVPAIDYEQLIVRELQRRSCPQAPESAGACLQPAGKPQAPLGADSR